MGLMPAHRAPTPISVARPSRLNSGTHKNLQRLVICPIYSVVKYRPRWLPPAARLSGYGSYSIQSVQTPDCLQPNVRRQCFVGAQHRTEPSSHSARPNIPPSSAARKLTAVMTREFQSNRPGISGLPFRGATIKRQLRNPPTARAGRPPVRYTLDLLHSPDQPPYHHRSYLCGGPASGSMPRSIFAMRSWCFRTSTVMAIAPPTMIATIGTSNPPRATIESTSLTRASASQRLSANDP
jgi:hypothetical protein